MGVTFEASLDGGAFATVSESFWLHDLTEGPHTISVRARDAANNVDATPATASWTVDLTLPTAAVVFPTPTSYSNAQQLHVRGTAHDNGSVVSVNVNGAAATTSDGFAHWSATVPLGVGDNTLQVSVADDAGNQNGLAAQAIVTNRGTALNLVQHMAYDAAGQRLLVIDSELRALVEIRTADSFAQVVSSDTRGTGPLLQQPWGLALDGNRVLVTDAAADTLVAVDIGTGNRTLLSPSPNDPGRHVNWAVAYDAATQRAYATTYTSVICIDLANGGARTVLSGGAVGSGVAFSGLYGGIVMDTTAATPTLLVADAAGHAVISVDIATGSRTRLSYAAPLDPGNAVGTGPSVYGLGQMFLDAPNHRLLVADVGPTSFAGRLLSVSLTNGDRVVLTPGTADISLRYVNGLAFDAARGVAFLASTDRSRIAQYDLSAGALARFHDSLVGFGPALASPPGLLLTTSGGSRSLIALRQDQDHLVQRLDLVTGERATVSIAGNLGSGPQWADTVSNLVADTRPGMSGKVLGLDYQYSNDTLSLRGLVLSSGDRSVIGSVVLPASRLMSHIALDVETNRAIVGLNEPNNAGASNLAAVDLTTGAVTDIASLAVGNGPPMFEITGVVVLPTTYPVTSAGRYIVSTSSSLLRINGSGDRALINGSGSSPIAIQDMAADLAHGRILVGGSNAHALQWVDLDSGKRSMVSGLDPDTHVTVGQGPPIHGFPFSVALDEETGMAYASVLQTAVMAIDLASGDRILVHR